MSGPGRGASERRADVWRVVEAARRVAKERASIVPDLVRTTGLSREGVELGFDRHLELDPSEKEIAALIAGAGEAKHVVVILSANVFVAALRAIAIARAASPSVVVRPSRREPHFARAIVERAKDPGLTVADEVDLGRLFGGEVHVYGRDATIASVRAKVGERIRVRGHGAGMGVAVVGPGCSLEDAARALAGDVIAFDQRGCLSPRVAFVEGEGRAGTFAEALHAALGEANGRVPRGVLHAEERAEGARYAATMGFAGRVLAGEGHVVGVGERGAPIAVPPAGRHVHVAAVGSVGEVGGAIGELARVIVMVGTDDLGRVAGVVPGHARVARLGEMQRPAFDGGVDRR